MRKRITRITLFSMLLCAGAINLGGCTSTTQAVEVRNLRGLIDQLDRLGDDLGNLGN